MLSKSSTLAMDSGSSESNYSSEEEATRSRRRTKKRRACEYILSFHIGDYSQLVAGVGCH